MSLRTVVVGLGQMGRCHALAYHANPGFAIIALVNRSEPVLPPALAAYPRAPDLDAALALRPDLVSISSHTDSHAEMAIRAMEAGAHVFVEKPLAATVEAARQVVAVARRTGRKLVVGYILRHHPGWAELVRRARPLGPPYVMRLSLNQPSAGPAWALHRRLMETTSPVVDCGVHYIDVMRQITDAPPVQVRGMGLRLTDEIDPGQVNYGHLQVLFADGSAGWFESGWGPMMSSTARFVKDVIGPRGAVSMLMGETGEVMLRLHGAAVGPDGGFAEPDRLLPLPDQPGQQALCDREQAFVLRAIHDDLDLSRAMDDAVRSLEVVLAADRSMHERRAIDL